MALVKKQNSRRSVILVIALLLVAIGGIGAVVWLQGDGAVETGVVSKRDLRIVDSFGVEVLRSPAVQALKSYGSVPVSEVPDQGGSPDPFHSTE